MDKEKFKKICDLEYSKDFEAFGSDFGLPGRTIRDWYYYGPKNKLFELCYTLKSENRKLSKELEDINQRLHKIGL